MSDADDDLHESPLLDALERVRWRIVKVAVALFAGMLVGFVLAHEFGLVGILVRPIQPFLAHQDGKLAAFSPLTGFMLELKVAFVVACALALPVLLKQVWGHFSPILLEEERRLILPSLIAAVVLFAGGVATGYAVLPISFDWLFAFQVESVTIVTSADEYFSFATRMLLAFGVVFEMPIVILVLTTLGIVTPKFLREKRRHAIVGITVLSSVITPGDVATMVLMAVPMVVFYEASILISVLIAGRRAEAETLGGSSEPGTP